MITQLGSEVGSVNLIAIFLSPENMLCVDEQ